MTKPKMSVPLSELSVATNSANGRAFVDAYNSPCRNIDPFALLRAADVRELSDEDKANYIVIKFAYVLFNPFTQQVALIDRKEGRHSNIVAKHSLLLASGLDAFYGAQRLGGELITNCYQPFTRKLGALVNEFEIPLALYQEFPRPVRFFSFVVRKTPERCYAFYIHLAALCRRNRFPSGTFALEYPDSTNDLPPDVVQGFFPLDEAERLVSNSDMPMDRFALSCLQDKPFRLDGMEGIRFSPRRTLAGTMRRLWNSILLRPSYHGIGIDLKKLGGGA